MPPRAAKNNALQAIKASNVNIEFSDIDVELFEDTSEEHKKNNTNTNFSQNAPNGYSLDLFKQYKRKIEFCDRDLIRVHDKAIKQGGLS